jgi:hypothetical protein
MFGPTSIREFLKDFAIGAVETFGKSSELVAITPKPDGSGHLALVREGYELQQLQGRTRGRRVHVFEDVESLAAWLLRHGAPEKVEVLVDAHEVVAMLDPRVDHTDRVSSPVKLHPRFRRWAELFGKQQTQKSLYRFIVGALEDFPGMPIEGTAERFSYGEKLAGDLLKFEAVRNSEVKIELDERGFSRFQSIQDKVTVTGSIAPKFAIRLPVLTGVLDPAEHAEIVYDIEILVEVIPASEKGPPTFVLSCPKVDIVLTQARADLVIWLRHLLAEKPFLVGLGKAQTQSVPDIEPKPVLAAIPQTDLE